MFATRKHVRRRGGKDLERRQVKWGVERKQLFRFFMRQADRVKRINSHGSILVEVGVLKTSPQWVGLEACQSAGTTLVRSGLAGPSKYG